VQNENYSMKQESAGRVNVRTALSNLPKATCPVGFEHRLVRRLESGNSGATKWYVPWAGAGLGFAAVVLFSVFTLNSETDTIKGGMTLQPKPEANVMTSTPADTPPIDVAIETQPVEAPATNPISTTSTELASTEKDSANQSRGQLPEGHYETVNQPVRGNGTGGR
jgi:hypothetical protein